MKKVIFTDLDGTLLDLKTYSFIQSMDAIQKLKASGIPIIFCSSKTRKEQEFYRDSLKINDPFIVENGSAIFIPKGYFKTSHSYNSYLTDEYEVIPLGKSVDAIRQALADKRSKYNLKFSVYSDLAPEEVSTITGLDLKSSRRAMRRDFSETILNGNLSETCYQELEEEGFVSIPGSKYETVIGSTTDKGKAVEILLSLYAKEYKKVKSYGIGDSKNDEAMLQVVDQPYLVQRPSGEWAPLENTSVSGVIGVGPLGWSKVANMILK